MKKNLFIISGVLAICSAQAATTIDPAHNDAYAGNVGWVNFSGDGAHGAVIGQAFCSGYIYSANCGWISLGDGSPDDGQAYGNDSATDWGVNHDGLGNLTGYAYGANIGWINFEQTFGQPRVSLTSGYLSGYIWSANVGWIRLRPSKADYVRTLTIASGPDTDADGIPDAWEFENYGKLNVLNGTDDYDGDGVSDLDEYLADTDPTSDADYLAITDFQTSGTTNWVTWPVKTTRLYTLEYTTALSNGTSWVEGTSFIPASGPDTTEEVPGVTDSSRFYRVKAAPPLNP